MQQFSIVSVAFNGYERYIDEFMRLHSVFSDDIIIDTTHDMSMGGMRQRAMSKARHPYIVNLDIDDKLLLQPDTFDDFVGLGWIEGECVKDYWLPGEIRSESNTIRSNFMISKQVNDKFSIPDKDFYIYEYIRNLYIHDVSFSKTINCCVRYDKHEGSLSENPVTDQHKQATYDLRRLDRTIK